VRSTDDIRRLLRAGADKVSVNTAAIRDPSLIGEAAARVGSQCLVVAIDAKRVETDGAPPRWEIFTHGGRQATGIDAVDWARRAADLGAGELLVTSMDRDGTRTGFDIALTRTIAEAVAVPIIASGGVGGLGHLHEGIVEGRADAVLAASIFHFGEHTVAEAKAYLAERGITVREPFAGEAAHVGSD